MKMIEFLKEFEANTKEKNGRNWYIAKRKPRKNKLVEKTVQDLKMEIEAILKKPKMEGIWVTEQEHITQ